MGKYLVAVRCCGDGDAASAVCVLPGRGVRAAGGGRRGSGKVPPKYMLCRLHGLLEGGEAGGGGVGSRKRKRLYARPRLELDFCGLHERARVTYRPHRPGQHSRCSASGGRLVWCSRLVVLDVVGGNTAVLQLLGGEERVFPKTTLVLESLANLGPQSCGDTRRGRTRRPSKAVSQSVSQQATVEAAGTGASCSPATVNVW